MAKTEPVSDEIHDISAYAPMSGRLLGEDGKAYNLVELLASIGMNGNCGGNGLPPSAALGVFTVSLEDGNLYFIADEGVRNPFIIENGNLYYTWEEN